MNSFSVYGIDSPKIIDWDDDVFSIFLSALNSSELELEDGDVIVITSKVVSMEEKARVWLEDVEPGEEAMELSQEASMDPRVVQLVLDEANGEIYGAVYHAILAKTRYGLSANAGIDLSNCPTGYALLLPRDPDAYARTFRAKIREALDIDVAVLITDSRTIPLKRGTTGVTLGLAGMQPLEDERGREDLYGYKMTITTRAVADNLATVANVVMGETNEQRPFAVIKDAVYTKAKDDISMDQTMMPEDQCLYFAPFIKLLHGEKEWL